TVTDPSKTHINILSSFAVDSRDLNTLIVSKRGADFRTVSAAIAYVDPTVPSNTNLASSTITSAALFTIDLNAVVVEGSGIVLGTVATYVDQSTMTLSA